jgi:metacaspase-1
MGKKALCVGINNFTNYPASQLKGCVNDASNMAGIFKSFLGFTDADITVLTDTQATKANIMSNLQAMVDGAKSGAYDYLVFSLSSHGTQVPDQDGDEPDKADEAFCPHDLAELNGEWDRQHIIVDDELHDLFVTLPPNVLLEVYFDTCHSGTGLKALDLAPGRIPRWLPPPSMEAFRKVEGRLSRGLSRSLLDNKMTNHILWAACRADQTSSDAFIKEDNSWNGAFTYYWCKQVRASQNKLSRSDLLNKVVNDLKHEYEQIPQLECEATNRKKAIR